MKLRSTLLKIALANLKSNFMFLRNFFNKKKILKSILKSFVIPRLLDDQPKKWDRNFFLVNRKFWNNLWPNSPLLVIKFFSHLFFIASIQFSLCHDWWYSVDITSFLERIFLATSPKWYATVVTILSVTSSSYLE